MATAAVAQPSASGGGAGATAAAVSFAEIIMCFREATQSKARSGTSLQGERRRARSTRALGPRIACASTPVRVHLRRSSSNRHLLVEAFGGSIPSVGPESTLCWLGRRFLACAHSDSGGLPRRAASAPARLGPSAAPSSALVSRRLRGGRGALRPTCCGSRRARSRRQGLLAGDGWLCCARVATARGARLRSRAHAPRVGHSCMYAGYVRIDVSTHDDVAGVRAALCLVR